jgi:hypothetical protein
VRSSNSSDTDSVSAAAAGGIPSFPLPPR